tara:strand:+ start:291 stop:446 length:156 start_codon:yes stop_codon:yes gene_type:complete
MWIDDLFEQQAIKFRDGWKIIEVINEAEEPRRSSCSTSPPSAEKIFIRFPL